jgi:hypothetical protein
LCGSYPFLSATIEAVWWNGAKAVWPDGHFDLAVPADINKHKGRRTVQLKVLDWRQSQQCVA